MVWMDYSTFTGICRVSVDHGRDVCEREEMSGTKHAPSMNSEAGAVLSVMESQDRNHELCRIDGDDRYFESGHSAPSEPNYLHVSSLYHDLAKA
jgi:hypothetical protein